MVEGYVEIGLEREHSLYNISLHLVQEYGIRQHTYKTANGP